MPDLLVHLKPATIAHLKERASRHGRSLADEISEVLDETVASVSPARTRDSWKRPERARQQIPKEGGGFVFPSSTFLIRQDRDSDHGRDYLWDSYSRDSARNAQTSDGAGGPWPGS